MKNSCATVIFLIILVLGVSYTGLNLATAQTSNTQDGNTSLQAAFTAVLAVEKAGANTGHLTAQLNSAAQLLADAQNSPDTAQEKIQKAQETISQVQTQALTLTTKTQKATQNQSYLNIAFLLLGIAVFSCTLMLNRIFSGKEKHEKIKFLKHRRYRSLLLSVGLVGLLVFASPTLGQLVTVPANEPFSSIYLLDSDHMLLVVPLTMQTNRSYSAYVCIDNYENSPSYYSCFVKLRVANESLPNNSLGLPSPAQTIYRYNAAVENGESWESPFNFQLSTGANSSALSSITVNDVETSIISTADDTNRSYDMVIELWKFDPATGLLQFYNRYVCFHLNIPNSPQTPS